MSQVVQPLQHFTYIPVGTVFTREQIGNLSLRELQHRSVYDPRYAGFESNFDWRQYVTVNIHDPLLRAQIEASLEQFSRTPEGQHIMRQSLAMQHFRHHGQVLTGEALRSPTLRTERVQIADCHYNRHGQIVLDHEGSYFNEDNGRLLVDRGEIDHIQYRSRDGQWHNYSVQDTLIHELIHSADAFIYGQHGNYLDQTHAVPLFAAITVEERNIARARAHGASFHTLDHLAERADQHIGRLGEMFEESPYEYVALSDGGNFMQTRYHVAPQVVDYGPTASRELRHPTNVGGPHFFDAIDVPVTPRLTTANRQGR